MARKVSNLDFSPSLDAWLQPASANAPCNCAEDRGYSEAPVSILYRDGHPPEMVFEKLNNTFSKRDHLRIWLRPDRYQGRPAWVCAATHDTGIDFSAKDRTFIHKIDSQIDMERSKVVNDLLLTGKVQSL